MGVRSHAPDNDQPSATAAPCRLDRLLGQDSHDTGQDRGRNVLTSLARVLPQVVEDRRLQPGEAEVEPGRAGHRSRKRDRLRVPLASQPIDLRSGGVSDPNHLADLVQRFSRGVVSGNGDGVLAPSEFKWDSSFGAGRDIGVQVFDAFPVGEWEHTYAVMAGNGNGLEPGRATFGEGGSGGAKLDTYLYWSSEWVFGGEGARREGWKTYIWSQMGERDFDATDDGAVNPTTHDRKRMGVGTHYRRGDWRLSGEYIKAEGMIFQGPEKPWFGIQNNGTSISPANLDLDGKADGWNVDIGYYIPGTKWELDARYDVLHRSTDHDNISADFKSLTGGIQYHLNKKSRITVNYENREMESLDATAPKGALAKGAPKVADRLGVQLTVIF